MIFGMDSENIRKSSERSTLLIMEFSALLFHMKSFDSISYLLGNLAEDLAKHLCVRRDSGLILEA